MKIETNNIRRDSEIYLERKNALHRGPKAARKQAIIDIIRELEVEFNELDMDM